MANVLFFKTLTKYCFLLFYLTLVSSTSSITYLEYLVDDEFVPIETPSLAVTEGDDITLYCYLDDDLKEKNDNIWWGLSYEGNETSIVRIQDSVDIVILGDETNSWSILQLSNASVVHRAFYHCCVQNGSQHLCDSNVLLRIKSKQALSNAFDLQIQCDIQLKLSLYPP